ncbi:MAG: methionyl-tRNA formyltransferase, partial [Amphiplicatus sp.]
RGAAPIQRAIMAGDTRTAAQVMRMEAGLDTGPILLSETVEIAETDTAASLHDRLAQVGAGLLPRALAALERGGLVETPQAEEGVVYADKISSAEARIDWRQRAGAVDSKIRGLSPFPGAWFEAPSAQGPQRVKALLSRRAEGAGAAGDILQADDRLVVACGDGAIELLRLQRAGKAAQGAGEFLRGFALKVGEKLA